MSWPTSLIVYIAMLTVIIIAGVPMAAAMGFVGLVGITLLSGTLLWPTIGDLVWNTT
ncbi:MAG: transporter large permease subunit, partial [Rhodospirillales bacterium]|nr:transporter large permease subunit [Rhodospirillales bacterium]